MNTEKLEKLKKSLDNKFIPDNMKDKIRTEIKKLESEIKTDETMTATEIKEEVKEIEKKVDKALEVAEKKEEQIQEKAPRKPRQKNATISRTKTPKVEPKRMVKKKSVFSIAKEIRKDGESWEQAKQRASKMMKSDTTETKKKVRTETDKLLASIRRKKELKNLTGTNIRIDMKRTALPKGKRISKDGNVYYEYRDDHTDRLAPSYKDKIYLAEGGGVGKMKKPRLKKGDNVTIIGKRWFDRANGNTYHTALVLVNGQSYGKSDITYGYDNAYLQTGKERLLKFYDLPRGMKETAPLWQLREYGVQFIQIVSDGLKRELAEGGAIIGTPETPLARGLDMDYTTLVGETGAMSSGEMFAKGGRTNERRHVNKSEDYEVRYAKTRPNRKGYLGKRNFAGGGGVGDESPKIYVADLEAYNNGKLSGVWLDLMDYNDADELMGAIQDFLKTTGGEEYAIHDVENIPSRMYSEYMGQRDFEELYEMIDLAKDNDLPLEVVFQVVSQYSPSAVDEFVGKYDSADDFAQELVDDIGIQSFIDFERYLIVSDTDRRLLAQEMADNYVDDIKDEDGGNRLIEEAGLDVDEYEEADSDRQEEMLDEAREIVYDEYYDTWYDGLSDPYNFLVEEQGLYSAEDFANANFVQIDYEALAENLEYDYSFIYNDGDLYVFNIR
jgi:antirestriction protein